MDVILQMDANELALDADNDVNDISFTAVVEGRVYGGNAYDIGFNGEMQVVVVSSNHADEDGPIPLTQELDPNTDAIERAVRHVVITMLLAQSLTTVGLSPKM